MNKKYLALIGVIIAFSIILAVMLFQSSTVNNATPKTLGFIGNAEQASITNVVFDSNRQVTVTIQNTGLSNITIVTAMIDGSSASIESANPSLIVNQGNSGTITLFSDWCTFANSAQYTISLTTAKGNTLVYTTTYSVP